MKEVNIDLGSKMDGGLVSIPESPNKYYPSFTYDSDEEMDLPKEGEMTIVYKKTASSESTRDGKTRYTCTIEVRKIKSIESEDDEYKEPASNRGKETEHALDKLVAAMKSKY